MSYDKAIASDRTARTFRLNALALRALLLVGLLSVPLEAAQDAAAVEHLSRANFKNGDKTLRAFLPVSKITRGSVVKLDINGATVALATIIDANGTALTKASEVKQGKLTCWLPSGKEVDADLLHVDEENDLALIKVHGRGLKPIQWATEPAAVGTWVVTPGTSDLPQAVGIVSARKRKILPKRALIGIQLDFKFHGAKIAQILEGMGAEKAGLKPGDQILAVNGSRVDEGDQLVKTLRQFREGQVVKLHIQREQEEFDRPVTMMIPKPSNSRRGVDREERMNRMGSEPSERAEGFELVLQHDTVLQNWQCGGPLVNLDGQAVGLNIARAGRVASYALPAELVQQAMEKFKKAEADKPASVTSKAPRPERKF